MRESSVKRRMSRLARRVSRALLLSIAGVGLTACAAQAPNYPARHHSSYGYGAAPKVILAQHSPDTVYRTHRSSPRERSDSGNWNVPGSYSVVIPRKHHHARPPVHTRPPNHARPPHHTRPPLHARPPQHARPPLHARPSHHARPPHHARSSPRVTPRSHYNAKRVGPRPHSRHSGGYRR